MLIYTLTPELAGEGNLHFSFCEYFVLTTAGQALENQNIGIPGRYCFPPPP